MDDVVLRQQIADALEYETIENDCDWDKWSLADVVLGLEPIRRALRIAAAAGAPSIEHDALRAATRDLAWKGAEVASLLIEAATFARNHEWSRNNDVAVAHRKFVEAIRVASFAALDGERAVGVVDPKPAVAHCPECGWELSGVAVFSGGRCAHCSSGDL